MSDTGAVERAARAVWKCWNPIAPAWGDAREQDRDEARAQARAALTAARAGESAQVDAGAAGATHPAHWERHGHPGEPCPPYGCAARAEPAAPTVEEVAEVLAAHGRTVTRRRAVGGGRVVAEEECGECGHALPWDPSKRARAVADHQAERVAALWGAR